MQGLVIYKSSAGSGKTFTLVLEYLKIVLANPEAYRQVLAVTFTNKATEEMKNRIISALDKLATTPVGQLPGLTEYTLLRAHFDALPNGHEVDLQDRARRVLNRILNDYTNFSISTIERFFQRVVRSFARELHIPLGFEVEMRQDLVLDQIVHDTLLEVGGNEELTRLFRGFVERNLTEERSWNVDWEIKQLGIEIFKEQFQSLQLSGRFSDQGVSIDEILALHQTLRGLKAKFEQWMESQAQEGLDIMSGAGLAVADFKYGKSGPAHYFVNVLEHRFEPGKRAREAAEDDKSWFTAKSPLKTQIQAVLPDLRALMTNLVDTYDQSFQVYNTAVQVSRTLFSYGVLRDLQRKLQLYRKEHAQMLISDTSFLLNTIIGEEFDAPFIYEKVGTRYKHFLLDEFQDTSQMQWKNLLPLVKESLGQGAMSLVVGDAKQSIYRWRNGDLRLLLHQVETDIRETGQVPTVEDLQDNWRTAKEIVSFNNEFFYMAAELLAETCEADRHLFESAYAKVEQSPRKTEIPGLVQIATLLPPKREKGEQGPDWKDLALERTLETIKQLRAEGFRGKDITLLVRTNREGIDLVEFLQQANERVVSAESLLLVSDPKVRLLESILAYLNHETDEVALASLWHHHQRVMHQSDSHHFHINISPEQILSDALRSELRQLSVYECAERLLRHFGLGNPINAYLQGFMDTILEYSSLEDANLDGFLLWWEAEKSQRSVAASLDPEAVQVLTIHKSKGLEFPVVILPFADWDLLPSKRGFLWVSPQDTPYDKLPYFPVRPGKSLLNSSFREAYETEVTAAKLDNLNVLYVAFTRPKYRLYAFTKHVKQPSVEKLSTLGALLQLVLGRVLNEEHIHEGGEGAVYQVGHLLEHSFEQYGTQGGHERSVSMELTQTAASYRPWQEAVRVKFGYKRRVDLQALQASQQEGNLIHDALAYVYQREDVPQAVERMIRSGQLAPDHRMLLTEQLFRITDLPDARPWFSTQGLVKNEAEIITSDGALLRPDRVVCEPNRVMVIDYKTGQPHQKYELQILRYMDTIRQLGHQVVEGYLYYLSLGRVDRVGDQLTLAL